MNPEQHPLDDFLRRKTGEAEFGFREADWTRMEALLDEQPRKRRRGWLWGGLAVLGGLLVTGALLLFGPRDKAPLAETVTVAPVAAPVKAGETTAAAASGEAVSAEGENSPNSEGGHKKIRTQGTSSASASAAEDGDRREGTQGPASSVPAAPAENRVAAETSPESNANVNPVAAAQTNEIKADSRRNTRNERNMRKAEQKGTVASRLNRRNKTQAPEMAPRVASATPQPAPAKPLQDALLVGGKPMRAIDSVERTPERTVRNPRYVPGLEGYNAERFDTVRIITLVPSPSPASTPLPVPEADSASNKRRTPGSGSRSIFATALLSANRGWGSTPASVRPMGLSPMLGLGGQLELRHGLSLVGQIGFTWFNGMRVNKQIQSYRYSFGVDSTAISIEYRRLMQFTLPVSLQYALSQRFSVFASLGLNYAMDVESRVQDKDGAASTVWGYRDGWRRLDGFAEAGLKANISQRFSAVMLYQQGFADMTQNSFFQQNATQRQSRMMLGLRYELKGHRK